MNEPGFKPFNELSKHTFEKTISFKSSQQKSNFRTPNPERIQSRSQSMHVRS
jgi:hypothetical protein